MGFNFQVGHPRDVFEDEHAALVERDLVQRFGDRVGTPESHFCLDDELGWPWWRDLQNLAAETLENADHIHAVDAWMGVYLDHDRDERVLIWPDGEPEEAEDPRPVRVIQRSWFQRLLTRLGLSRDGAALSMAESMLNDMIKANGPREGENGALQVGNLRRLKAELDALLESLGVDPTTEAVEATRMVYSEDDDRVDDDPAIQCLCHAWLTADRALRQGAPMWLLK